MIWRKARHRRSMAPSVASADRIAELEREAAQELHRQDRERDKAIAAAECARDGHVEPGSGPLTDAMDIYTWGIAEPIRVGPHCVRCGANLAKEES